MGSRINNNVINIKEYILLKDFRMEIEVENEKNLSLSFWVYLIDSYTTKFPATIIKQVHLDITSSAPFIVLNEKMITLFPLLHEHKETTNSSNSASMEIKFPLENWIHVGFEVLTDILRLHINGEIASEQPQSSSLYKNWNSNGPRKIALVGACADDGLQGYVYRAEVLPLSLSIKDHYVKDPPLWLSIDLSSTSEIDEGNDGIWNIVGGKASCRRVFSLDVVFLNAMRQVIDKELEIFASLIYVDNGLPVEKTSDDEDPLLTSCDGIEFSNYDRPGKLLHGRASLKLKISQLSSKCENRLFCIKIEIPKFNGYHFLEAYSHPIRCISRSRNPRTSLTWKRPTTVVEPFNKFQSFGLYNGSIELQHNSIHEIRPSPSSKRIKLGQEKTFAMEKPNVECYSDTWTTNQNLQHSTLPLKLDGRDPSFPVENTPRIPSNMGVENIEEADNSSSVSDSIEGRLSNFKITSSSCYSISDVTIFKYCLGGLIDKALLLKEVATSASEEELFRLANEVSLYSGCSHHRRQIVIAKRLIEEGTKIWNSISQNNRLIQWEKVIFEIEEQFMRITCSSTRSLTEQDFELLRRIAGCREHMGQENFEKIWRWLYPVIFTLASDPINTTWNSTSPKWIEGFITKEEAELSLQGPRGLQEPGTFVLRFPTSRSWPHPDAGSLIVTYVGSDHTVHHRLLSLDYIYSCEERGMNLKSLEQMLLAEPELCRLGRIVRQSQ